MKNILMIAFHYPPYSGGSGVHRTLKFSRYLPQFGWRPIILTAHDRAYTQTSSHQLQEIPSDVLVSRAFALDTARHLSFKGAYVNMMALPDRWVSWLVGAVPLGMRLIRKYKPEAIWSTYPIATAHLIGFVLSKITGIPWVADFRDSMTEDHYPRDPRTKRCYQWIERNSLSQSARSVFTAGSTKNMYLSRYSWLKNESCLVIPNGFDELDFQTFDMDKVVATDRQAPLRLVHAGVVYPEERDPRPLFKAVAKLKVDGLLHANMLRIEFRGSGSEDMYTTILHALDITDIIHLLPSLPYRESLEDCALSDALLLLQGASCNHQIPAKAYEYLRLQKPVLALTDNQGDTASLLRECGGATICNLHDEAVLYKEILAFLKKVRTGTHPIPENAMVEKYSRKCQAGALARYLDQTTESVRSANH